MHLPPPRTDRHYLGGVLMRRLLHPHPSPRRNLHLSLRERSARVTRRVRAFLTAPSPHPASAARLLTSPSGRGKEAGFSLIELAIVLVILGLLVGGIMTGQSLIRAAELRSVTADLQRYQASLFTFRDKYFALPGDMINATAFWGAAHPTPATCRTTSSTTTATCDGNGDGSIFTMDGWTTMSEMFHAWKHLSNAGLIEGSYTGVSGSGGIRHAIPGQNAPKGRLNNGCFNFMPSNAYITGDVNVFDGNYANAITYGGASANIECLAPMIAPSESWAIDVKLDDGKPAYGVVRNHKTSVSTCITTNVASTSEYNLTSTQNLCVPIFMNDSR
jgi:prepilin-type N-terminal cleavage/methylation domain-containing protein